LPFTVAVPTVIPPVAQLVGALACGPNTVNVTDPVAALVAPDRTAGIDAAVMGVLAASVAGALKRVVVETGLMTVDDIVLPHPLLDGTLDESPL
jgi:hypothetical protein